MWTLALAYVASMPHAGCEAISQYVSVIRVIKETPSHNVDTSQVRKKYKKHKFTIWFQLDVQ